MDDIEDDAKCPPNPYYGISHHQGYGYQNSQKFSVRNESAYSQPVANESAQDNNYSEDEKDGEGLGGEDDGDEDVDQNNSFQLSPMHLDDNDDEEDDDIDGDDNENEDNKKDDDEEDANDGDGDGDENDDDDDDNDDNIQKSYAIETDDELQGHPKKKKLKSLISTYEFAPRVPAPSAASPSVPKPSFGGRNPLTDWTEQETFVLLDAWGDRFLQHRRKSLRSEEWHEVAEKVSEFSNIERTDTQCRNRLDTLKKKYKKEKIQFPEIGGGASKWVYFKKMDELMLSPPQQAGLPCGLDSGEYVSMNPRVHVSRGKDEMKDSPRTTESISEEGSDRPQARKRRQGKGNYETSSFKLLADSIQKFSNIYEKIENSKVQQMMELEKMRMDFLNDLETQKKQILKRWQGEISKLEQRDDENDDSGM